MSRLTYRSTQAQFERSMRTISYSNPTMKQTDLGAGNEIAIPTSWPGSNLVQYTVEESDFNRCYEGFFTVGYTGHFTVSGFATTACTLYCRVYKDDSYTENSFSISAGRYWTYTGLIPTVSVGTVIGLRCYSSVADTNLRLYTLAVVPGYIKTRLNGYRKWFFKDFQIGFNDGPVPTIGNPYVYTTDSSYFVYRDSETSIPSPSTKGPYEGWLLNDNINFFRIANGYASALGRLQHSTTSFPYYYKLLIPYYLKFGLLQTRLGG